MAQMKKSQPAVTEIWVQTDTQDQLLDSPLVTGPVVNNKQYLFETLQNTFRMELFRLDGPCEHCPGGVDGQPGMLLGEGHG